MITFYYICGLFTSFLLCFSVHASTFQPPGSVSEKNDEKMTIENQRIQELISKSTEWLQNQRVGYVWPITGTAHVAIALGASQPNWPPKNDPESAIVVKEVEIELLSILLRGDSETPSKVATYCLALNAICKDPHDFYGHNLIGSIRRHSVEQDLADHSKRYAYIYRELAICLSGSPLHKHQAKHLLKISRNYTQYLYSEDIRAMSLLALECFRRRKNSEALRKSMQEPLEKLSTLQKADGSFGSMHTTGLITQVLSASQANDVKWNRTSAILYLESLQDEDGSFGKSILQTSKMIVDLSSLLNRDGVLGLTKSKCRHLNSVQQIDTKPSGKELVETRGTGTRTAGELKLNEGTGNSIDKVKIASSTKNASSTQTTVKESQDDNATNYLMQEVNPAKEAPFVNVTYWLWIGPNPVTAEKHNLTLQVHENSTFFYVMQRAAELSPDFEFSSTVWPNGHYVHTISGHREQPVGYHYWLLYCLNSDPDPNSPPATTFVAPAGVDDLKVQDGQVFLFWFKKL